MLRFNSLITIIASLSLIGAGCAAGPSTTSNVTAALGESVTLVIGQSADFTNGPAIILKEINDSRCQPNVQCIWAGELAPVLRLHGHASGSNAGNPFAANPMDFTLGTVRMPTAQVGGFWLMLTDATINTATLTVVSGNYLAPSLDDSKVKLASPQPGALVTSPLQVSGQAVGQWYFEASFPITLLDANGKILVQTHAQAQSDWMTTSFVPYLATVNFETPTTDTGTLVLHKDNASGLPEHDDSRTIPVRFR